MTLYVMHSHNHLDAAASSGIIILRTQEAEWNDLWDCCRLSVSKYLYTFKPKRPSMKYRRWELRLSMPRYVPLEDWLMR